MPPAEVAVAEAALAGGGPIAEQFVAQLREAPDVWREIGADGSYELQISTSIDVRGAPRAGWKSRPIRISAQPDERPLEIELLSSVAGIIELRGRALDGLPWPTKWSVRADDLASVRSHAPWMDLPTPTELREQRARAVEVIEAWLREPTILQDKRGAVVTEPPAALEDIEGLEAREAFDPLPASYRQLLLVANGFEIGSLVVLGTNDAYKLDLPGPDRLVITPPNENGVIVLTADGEVRFVELGDQTSDGRLEARDLRDWTRRRVRRKPRT